MRVLRRLFESSVLRYLGVGGTAFVVDFGATVLARDVLIMPLWLAVSIGFLAGFFVNFGLQRNFSFQSDRPYAWSVVLYLLLVLFNWGATTLGMYVFVGWIGFSTAIGKIICTVITTLWNYPLYRFVVFPLRKKPVQLAPSVPVPQSIDVVIPAHNSSTVLAGTVKELRSWAEKRTIPLQAIIVENGSTDGTGEIIRQLSRDEASEHFSIIATSSKKGLGVAYRKGIAQSQAELVVLSADDLPFGTSDIDAWLQTPIRGLAIGSKTHPDSQVERGFARSVSSAGFRFLRSIVLHSKVGDPQGTLIADGRWLRTISQYCQENGYLSSTEIVAIAEAQPIPITELPVTLTERQSQHHTRITFSDIREMGTGLVRIKKHSQSVVDHCLTTQGIVA